MGTRTVDPWVGFALGMAGWGFILFEIFAGEAGKIAGTGVSGNVKASFGTMRFIVSVGWSIYPLGHFFGYLMGGVDENVLNFVYNFADMLNKIWPAPPSGLQPRPRPRPRPRHLCS